MIQVKFMDIFLDKCACLLLARDNSLRVRKNRHMTTHNFELTPLLLNIQSLCDKVKQ